MKKKWLSDIIESILAEYKIRRALEKMEKILEMLQAMQIEQKEFRMEMNEFRLDMNERLESLEKYAIQNGEKLENNWAYTSKKMNFIEHKNLELEQRIYELESRYGQ